MTSTNLVLHRGDSLDLYFEFTRDGVAVPISGWVFFLTIKRNITDPDASAVVSKTVTTHTLASLGKTTVSATASDLDGLSGVYGYDVQVKKPGNKIKTVISGSITFIRDYTRRTQ